MTRLRRPRDYARLPLAIVLVACLFVVGSPWPAAAAEPPGADLLRKAATFIEAQKAFRVVVKVEDVIEAKQFGKRVLNRTFLLSVARPDRLAMREQGEAVAHLANDNEKSAAVKPSEAVLIGMAFVTDGKKFSRGAAAFKKFDVNQAPSSLDEVFCDPIAFQSCTPVGNRFFRELLFDNVYEGLTYDATASRDMGTEEIDGQACGHLRLEQNDAFLAEFIWDLWVDTGAAPLIRKVSIQPKEPPQPGDKDDKQLKQSVVLRLDDWDLAPKFAEDEFAFHPPADWEKVDSIYPRQPARDFANRPGSLTSLGGTAPDITLTPLEGPAIPLADLRGRVVLLNFFATWCGPCLSELPDLQKIWNEFHGHDDFRMFAIGGQDESAETIGAFKAEHHFTFPMATDVDHAVYDRFATESIPRTYLIDREGKIVYQCTGYDSEKKERTKLRAILKSQLGKPE